MKTLLAINILSSLLAFVLAGGEFAVLHSPSGIRFVGSESLRSDELPKVLSTAMGHTTEMDDLWSGLSIHDPFNYPYVGIVISVQGVPSLQFGEQRYPLQMSANMDQIKEDYLITMGDDVLFDQNDLNSGENNGAVSFNKLDSNSEAASELANDLGVIQDLKQKAMLKIPIRNVWIQLNSLRKISIVYGKESEEMAEATNLMKSSLNDLASTLDVVFNKRYILSVITSDQGLVRERRQAPRLGKETDPLCAGLNLSKQYGEDYAAIFNIILWTSVFLIAALISTAVFICTMDPGRDSIIYRMTTQRMKKDN